jgi:hypothetical protein
LTVAPWIDGTNRRALRRFEYVEPPRQGATRFAAGVATLTFLGTLFLAAYYDELDMSLTEIWIVVIGAPVLVGAAMYVWCKELPVREQLDATSADTPGVRSPIVDPTALHPPVAIEGTVRTVAVAIEEQGQIPETETEAQAAALRPPVPADRERPYVPKTVGAREERARATLVAALQECGDLATAVEQLEGDDLLEVLQYIDSLRLGLTESNQVLQGVLQGYEAEGSD